MILSIEATGTEPLSYQWEWNQNGEGGGRELWQSCDVESFPGANSSILTVSSVQKSNEGSYRCVVSNCAGSQASNPAELSVSKYPRSSVSVKYVSLPYIFSFNVVESPKVTTHPQDLNDVVPGKPVMFNVQATGTKPLSCWWEWKPAESEEWQLCDAQGSNSVTLTILSVQKSNEGSYRCVISNCAGNSSSEAAELTVGKNLHEV